MPLLGALRGKRERRDKKGCREGAAPRCPICWAPGKVLSAVSPRRSAATHPGRWPLLAWKSRRTRRVPASCGNAARSSRIAKENAENVEKSRNFAKFGFSDPPEFFFFELPPGKTWAPAPKPRPTRMRRRHLLWRPPLRWSRRCCATCLHGTARDSLYSNRAPGSPPLPAAARTLRQPTACLPSAPTRPRGFEGCWRREVCLELTPHRVRLLQLLRHT